MKTCQKCNKEFKGWIKIDGESKNLQNRKYCLNCSPFKEHNTRNFYRIPRPQIDKICLNCKGTYHSKYSKSKYCSNKCQQKYEVDEYIRKWLNNEEDGITCTIATTSVLIRHYLFETRGEKCEKCGWNRVNEYTNKIPLNLHHIDGNSYNNRPTNLEILCPNCHALTKYFGAKNKGNGRKNRYNVPMT